MHKLLRARVRRAILATKRRERKSSKRGRVSSTRSHSSLRAGSSESLLEIGRRDKRDWNTSVVLDHLYKAKIEVMPSLIVDFDQLSSMVSEWNCDVFAIGQMTRGRPLYFVAITMFRKFHLSRIFGLDPVKLLRFFERVEDAYIADNPYHNPLHAADVLQTVCYLATNSGLAGSMTDIEVFALLVAAMVHDMGHPGTNNNFQVASRSPLALRYNDSGVLEQYHAATAFEVMYDPPTAILSTLATNQLSEFRSLVIKIVLATDMSQHFDYLGKFKLKLESDALDFSDAEMRTLLLEMAIKCADISNPTKTIALCEDWAYRVMEEFFQQGTQEASLGLPVSPFMERSTTKVPKVQTGFIDFFVIPLFEAFARVPSVDLGLQLDQLRSNRDYWDARAQEDNSSLASSRSSHRTK